MTSDHGARFCRDWRRPGWVSVHTDATERPFMHYKSWTDWLWLRLALRRARSRAERSRRA